jgi:hypothetical protein
MECYRLPSGVKRVQMKSELKNWLFLIRRRLDIFRWTLAFLLFELITQTCYITLKAMAMRKGVVYTLKSNGEGEVFENT